MKKLLLTLTLLLISTEIMAEWTKIYESNQQGGYTVYADLTSIRKAGDRVKMWILLDYNTEQKASGVNFLSKTIRHEYNCKENRIRILAFKLFSWNMEGGKRIRTYNQPQPWEEMQPDKKDETGWSTACNQQ